jgi:hypothetical protein
MSLPRAETLVGADVARPSESVVEEHRLCMIVILVCTVASLGATF